METGFLITQWLGTPLWMWLAFVGVVAVLLALDLGVLHRETREIGVAESLMLSTVYICIGLLFGGWVWWTLGSDAGMNYLTGFAIEKALAMDNVFVIAMIFSFFSVPRAVRPPPVASACSSVMSRSSRIGPGRCTSP